MDGASSCVGSWAMGEGLAVHMLWRQRVAKMITSIATGPGHDEDGVNVHTVCISVL